MLRVIKHIIGLAFGEGILSSISAILRVNSTVMDTFVVIQQTGCSESTRKVCKAMH